MKYDIIINNKITGTITLGRAADIAKVTQTISEAKKISIKSIHLCNLRSISNLH